MAFVSHLWLFDLLFCILYYDCSCLEVDVLNTATATSNLQGWIAKTYVNNIEFNSSMLEWQEVSFNQANITQRGFSICQNTSLLSNVKSWLYSPFVSVEGASHIYVELKFWMRECPDHHDTRCRETFKVYHQYENDFSSAPNNRFNHELYTSIDTVAAEYTFTSIDDHSLQTVNTEVVSFSIPKSSSTHQKIMYRVSLAFVDEGACTALSSVRIYYKVCPATTFHLAHFPESHTGSHKTSLVAVSGKCVDKSQFVSSHFIENQSTPLYHCTGSGSWNIRTGQCLCNPGYQPDTPHSSCTKCPLNSYKSDAGNQVCSPCPPNSITDNRGATSCQCSNMEKKFQSLDLSQYCDQCASLPSPPTELSISYEEGFLNGILLKWNAPLHNGYCKNVQYCIFCQSCIKPIGFSTYNQTEMKLHHLNECSGSYFSHNSSNLYNYNCDELDYSPGRCSNRYNVATIDNLNPLLSYKFTVLAVNSVTINRRSRFFSWLESQPNDSSEVDQDPSFNQQIQEIFSSCGTSVTYHSRFSPPSTVIDVHATEKMNGQVIIKWTPPAINEDKFLKYEVRWCNVGGSKSCNVSSTMIVNNLTVTLTHFKQGALYSIDVRAFNSAGFGNYSKSISLQMTVPKLVKTTVSTISLAHRQSVYIGIALFFALLILSCVVIMFRNSILTCGKVKSTLHPTLDRSNIQTSETDLSTDAYRTYVDPYHLRAMQPTFNCETDPEHVTTMSVIGCGEFGEVYRGTLIKRDLSGQGNDMIIDVAVKQLRAQCEPHEQFDFLREATALSRFRHPNIVKLEAVVTKSRPFMIVTELMKHGCLSAFLKRHGQAGFAFPPLILVRMLKGVAMGMDYITALNYVHRDLAARNVLINDELECKVADFGLTQHRDDNFKDLDDINSHPPAQGGKIAIRWTAPEAIACGAYSQASDVWSFGVLAWELTTYGEKPYWNLTNQQVFQAINDGFRLPASEDCPALLHRLMLDCWHSDRHARPTFSQLVSKLNRVIEFPDVLSELAGPASTGADDLLIGSSLEESCSPLSAQSRDDGKDVMKNIPASDSQYKVQADVSTLDDTHKNLSETTPLVFPTSNTLATEPTEFSSLLAVDRFTEQDGDDATKFSQSQF